VTVVVGAGQAADQKTLVAKTLDYRAQTWNLQALEARPAHPLARGRLRVAERAFAVRDFNPGRRPRALCGLL
jgi:hypothetical protein